VTLRRLRSFLLLLAFACVASTHPASASSVVLSDGEFAAADWTTAVVSFGDGGTPTVDQVLTGGNPGSFRRIDLAIRAAPSPTTFSALWLFNIYDAAGYDPATQGAILSIDYGEDSIYLGGQNDLGVPLGTSNGAHAVSIALVQNGILYTSTAYLANSESWTSRAFTGLGAGDFFRADGAAGSPDFSSTGAPMQLGFLDRVSGSVGGIGFDTATGIDNWSVTIHSVPEPSTAILLGLSLAGLFTLSRRGQRRERSLRREVRFGDFYRGLGYFVPDADDT